MKRRIAVVSVDGRIAFYDEPPVYETLRKHIGGWLEGVELHGGYGYIDEEGKLKGLNINSIATGLYIYPGDYIVGPLVVVGPVKADGEHLDLTKEQIARLLVLRNCRICHGSVPSDSDEDLCPRDQYKLDQLEMERMN